MGDVVTLQTVEVTVVTAHVEVGAQHYRVGLQPPVCVEHVASESPAHYGIIYMAVITVEQGVGIYQRISYSVDIYNCVMSRHSGNGDRCGGELQRVDSAHSEEVTVTVA